MANVSFTENDCAPPLPSTSATYRCQRRLNQPVQVVRVLFQHLLQVLKQVPLSGVRQIVPVHVRVLQHLPALDHLLRRLCTPYACDKRHSVSCVRAPSVLGSEL